MDELRRLFVYNRWATTHLLDAAETLSAEELKRDLGSSFPTLLATLTHLIGAEWVWLERWKGNSPTAFPDTSAIQSVPAVRARFQSLWQDQQAFLDTLADADRARSIHYKLFSGQADTRPLAELMRHVTNHATYHRGQIVMMLRLLGKAPPSTDYVRWLRETS